MSVPIDDQRPAIANAGFTVVDRIALLYLAVPVALFFLQWSRPIYGVPLALAAIAGFPVLLRGPFGPRPPTRTLIVAGAIAFAWTILGGAGHFFYSNAFDWVVRDAVLRDMVKHAAPVAYTASRAATVILRAPIAYFVVPALIGKVTGLNYADLALFVWTFIGVLLFLLQILCGERRLKTILLIATVVILSGGIAIIIHPNKLFDLGNDKVWWAVLYQYSPITTLLFWVPNHALPGWLSIATLYRARDDRRFVGLAAWLGAVDLLWSPLAALGMLPFFALLAWRRFRRGEFKWLITVSNVVAAPLIVAASALYLTAGWETIKEVPPETPPDLIKTVKIYILFVFLEFLTMSVVLWTRHRNGIDKNFFFVAIGTLLILPLFHFGPNNDLVMRASIPALAVILFSLVDGWARPDGPHHRGGIVLALICLGTVSPLTEIARSLIMTRWPPNLERSVYAVTEGVAPNYLLPLEPASRLAALLKTPVAQPDCPVALPGRQAGGVLTSTPAATHAPLVIVNGFDADILVKLRSPRQATVLSAFVPARSTVKVSRPAGGPFEVLYATGSRYSAPCQMFLENMVLKQSWKDLGGPGDNGSILDPAKAGRSSLRPVDVPDFLFN